MITRSLNTAVNDVLLQGCIFLDRIGDETYARPLEGEFAASSALTIGTCSITFSVWRKEFGLARSTTISGVETRNWRAR